MKKINLLKKVQFNKVHLLKKVQLKKIHLLKEVHSSKYQEEEWKTALLKQKIISAERNSNNSSKQAAKQQSTNLDIMKSMKKTTMDNNILGNRIVDLECGVEEGRVMLAEATAAVPIMVIKKQRQGLHGAPGWPVYIYELLMEQIVNGTPPSSINGNIIAHVKAFSPMTIIKELPSIWTIRRTRTILLIVVQTLAAYCLGRSDKWQQLFTDGTS